ncbi:unnamed protein product [Moneuplotes crassus]|uniref:Uncharacterized protein n=1 Tax=Euplotes crassus TaxID=5936 RepID=A0AAD1UGD4_EUPCR|nr:unnamed protein product [Moneuplotes crassus]
MKKTKAQIKLENWKKALKNCSSSFKAISREKYNEVFGSKTDQPGVGKYSPNYRYNSKEPPSYRIPIAKASKTIFDPIESGPSKIQSKHLCHKLYQSHDLGGRMKKREVGRLLSKTKNQINLTLANKLNDQEKDSNINNEEDMYNSEIPKIKNKRKLKKKKIKVPQIMLKKKLEENMKRNTVFSRPRRIKKAISNSPSKAAFVTSVADKTFSYDNIIISSEYHLVKDKKSRSDVQIVPSQQKDDKMKGCVAFAKLSKRKLHSNAKSNQQLLSLEELGDKYMRRHCPSVDFGKLVQRDTNFFLYNKMYCGQDYDYKKDYISKQLPSLKNHRDLNFL